MSQGKRLDYNPTPQEKQVEQAILAIEPTTFHGLKPQQRKKLIESIAGLMAVHHEVQLQSYSGPIPDPETLNKFNQIIPNGADRIMVMAEEQAKHRMAQEAHVIKCQQSQSSRGQWMAFIIAIFFAFMAKEVTVAGYQWAGLGLGGGTLVALVTIFIQGRKKQKNQLTKSSS